MPGAAVTATLKASIEVLQMELAKVEALASGRRADFECECERERANAFMAELLRMTADTMLAKKAKASQNHIRDSVRPPG
jgi:redox-regulated HSP33 family molecular chaperone